MSFLDTYLNYTAGNKASAQYHKWAGLSILSNLVSRRIWIDREFFTLYPNLYIFLVGNPAAGKTTAMSAAKGLMQKYDDKRPIAADKLTKEALFEQMGKAENHQTFEQPTGTFREFSHLSVYANELVTFLGDDPRIMVEFLTDIFDAEVFKNDTKNKGKNHIRGPYISVLGCLTPSILDGLYQQKLIVGGFTRRVIYVWPQEPPRCVAFPKRPDPEDLKECHKHAERIMEAKGEMKWSDACREHFQSWHDEKFKRTQSEQHPGVQGFLDSMDSVALKVAALLSISENNNLIMEDRHLSEAILLMEASARALRRVFGGAGQNELSAVANFVMQYLRTRPSRKAHRRELLRLCYSKCDAKGFDEVMKFLVDTEQVKILKPFKTVSTVPNSPDFDYAYVLSETEGGSDPQIVT